MSTPYVKEGVSCILVNIGAVLRVRVRAVWLKLGNFFIDKGSEHVIALGYMVRL